MAYEELIVMVHAFDSDLYDSQSSFNQARQLVLASDSPLIVLTSDLELSRIKLGSRKHKLYLTSQVNPTPTVGWDNFSAEIREYNLPVLFMGAELHFDKTGKPYTGCVLEAYERTIVNSKRIDFSKCWVGE